MGLSATDTNQLREILERDRAWSAYALADLDPAFAAGAEWHVGADAVVLRYAGLEPPVLFMAGDVEPAIQLARRLPAGPVQYTLLATHRARLGAQLQVSTQLKMWRMLLQKQPPEPPPLEGLRPLGAEHEDEILRLMADHPDRPDSFAAFQLDQGVFFGVWRGGRLLAMSGTHVLSQAMSIAALGNVFTDPSARGQGLGTATSAAVLQALAAQGVETIVLNVSMDNQPALKMYERLGFMPYCGYYEGLGELLAADQYTME